MKRVYHLYALPVTEWNLQQAYSSRFSRIVPEYILIYKTGKKPEGAVRIEKKDIGKLSDGDTAWLCDCFLSILGERVKEQAPKSLEMLEKLELELEKRQQEYLAGEGAEKTDGQSVEQ